MIARPGRAAVIAAVTLAAAAAVAVSVMEPLDHGYGRYATIAEAMARGGDYVVPRLGGEVYFDKPPLFPWLVALVIRVAGGVPEAAAHVPNLLAGAALLLLTGGFGRARRSPPRAGPGAPSVAPPRPSGAPDGGPASVAPPRPSGAPDRGPAAVSPRDARAFGGLAALILATSLSFVQQSREERLDLVFATAVFGAQAAWFASGRAASVAASRRVAFASGVALAAAFLTKGPVGPALFLAAVSVNALLGRGARGPRADESVPAVRAGPRALLSASGFLAVALPWPALLLQRLGHARVAELLRETDFATRFESWLYYARELPAAVAPWTLLLPALAIWLVQRRPWRRDARVRFAWASLVGPLLLLQLSPAKNVRYLLPVLPWIALLLAAMIAGGLARRPGLAAARTLASFAIRIPAALLPVGAGLLAAWLVVEGPRAAAWIPAAAALALVPWAHRAAHAARLGHLGAGARWLALALLIASATFDGVRAVEFAGRDRRAEAERALAAAPADRPLLALDLDRPDAWVLPLLVRRDVPDVDDAGELRERLARAGDAEAWVVMAADALPRVAATPGLGVERAEPFTLRGRPVLVAQVRRTGGADRG